MGEWFSRADCRDHPFPDMWFAAAGTIERQQALQICNKCPVRQPCATLGMEHEFGIWGGFSEERREVVRRLLKHGKTLEEVIAWTA